MRSHRPVGCRRSGPGEHRGHLAVLLHLLAGSWVDEEVLLDATTLVVGDGIEGIRPEQLVEL